MKKISQILILSLMLMLPLLSQAGSSIYGESAQVMYMTLKSIQSTNKTNALKQTVFQRSKLNGTNSEIVLSNENVTCSAFRANKSYECTFLVTE